MPVSEAQKRANRRYDSENMTTVGVKISKKKAAEFKAACQALGVTTYSVLKQSVEETITRAQQK